MDYILEDKIEEQGARVKQRRVHVVANLGCGHALFDVIEDLPSFLTDVQRLRPSGIQLKEGSLGRYDGAITGPLINPINAVHYHRSDLNLNPYEIVGWKFAVEKFEVGFIPDEKIVDDLQGAGTQHFGHVLLADKAARREYHPYLAAGLALN